ncbi:MAG TPA: LytTR family DNA-binding domain-containing protein [Chitinophagaceae bacterium]|nr:LytTR family DNA-binding domain-containing protein [Chitinophagaceae bacterium]
MRVIIVDDEVTSSQVLEDLIKHYQPELQVIAVCNTAADAVFKLNTLNPDIVFMDIELPGMSGFDILEKVKNIHFEVIFTTAHMQYGIRAIQFSAIDYLLKPIHAEDLQQAIIRVQEHGFRSNPLDKIKNLFENVRLLNNNAPFEKVAFPTSDGLKFIPLDQILRCMASNNYTYVYLVNKDRLLISKSLKEIENILPANGFCRIHNSHLVNLKYIQKLTKGESSTLVMNDNTELEVSRRKKEELVRILNL